MDFKFKVKIPTRMRLKVNGDKTKGKLGSTAARHIRARLEDGRDARGTMTTKSGGRPLRDSGQLIKSIKSRKLRDGRRAVLATGSRDRGKRNQEILSILIATLDPQIDPLGMDKELAQKLQLAGDKDLARQAKRGEYGLLWELKKLR